MAILKQNQSDDLTLKYLLQNAGGSDSGTIQQILDLLGTTSLPTTAQTVTGAIAEHEVDISGINSKIGNTALPTTAQTLTGAIAEVDGDIGSISTTIGNTVLPTTAQTLTGAIAEIDGDVGSINTTIGTTALPTTAQTITGAIDELDTDIDGKVSKTGDTMTGRLDMSGNGIRFESTNITNGTVVASGTEGNSKFEFRDNDNNLIGQVYPFFDPNSDQSLIIYTQREIGNDTYTNYISLGIDSSGNFKVSMPNDPWRRRLRIPQITIVSNVSSGSKSGNADSSFTHDFSSLNASEILAIIPYGFVPTSTWATSIVFKEVTINGSVATFYYRINGTTTQTYIGKVVVFYLP